MWVAPLMYWLLFLFIFVTPKQHLNMAALTPVFLFILDDTPETILHPFQSACTRLFTSFPHYLFLWTVDHRYLKTSFCLFCFLHFKNKPISSSQPPWSPLLHCPSIKENPYIKIFNSFLKAISLMLLLYSLWEEKNMFNSAISNLFPKFTIICIFVMSNKCSHHFYMSSVFLTQVSVKIIILLLYPGSF